MEKIFETAQGKCLYVFNGKFYTDSPEEIVQALKEDMDSDDVVTKAMSTALAAEILSVGMSTVANYVWLNFKSKTGSIDSKLVMNGCYPFDALTEELKAIPAKELIKFCPKWIELSEITLTAQRLKDSKLLYRRTITIHKKSESSN